MSESSIYVKCCGVVDSCTTTKQLNVADKFIMLAFRNGNISINMFDLLSEMAVDKHCEIIGLE